MDKYTLHIKHVLQQRQSVAAAAGADLHAWEDGKVDLGADVVQDLCALLGHLAHALAVEDHSTPGTPQRLVGGGSDHIRVVER